jgi:hypothetical protein
MKLPCLKLGIFLCLRKLKLPLPIHVEDADETLMEVNVNLSLPLTDVAGTSCLHLMEDPPDVRPVVYELLMRNKRGLVVVGA